jgi:hypothetical protein
MLKEEVAKLLKAAGFILREIGIAIKDIFFATIDGIKDLLVGIGYPSPSLSPLLFFLSSLYLIECIYISSRASARVHWGPVLLLPHRSDNKRLQFAYPHGTSASATPFPFFFSPFANYYSRLLPRLSRP